jgi:hypothetical protein
MKFNQRRLLQVFVPVVYSVIMLLVVFYMWRDQYLARQGGDGPLYRNLREYPAWIRHGFDPADIDEVPTEFPHEDAGKWMRFDAPRLTIKTSPLPDLPKRAFLSPRGNRTQEFTVIIPLEMDGAAIEFLDDTQIKPGIFLAFIGENWEIFLTGR